MGTLDFLVGAQLEKYGRQIRQQLVDLRRRKLILSASNSRPERNPALDPLLDELHRLRIRLEFQIHKVESEISRAPFEDEALSRAREILGDAAEMIDLVVWFGARETKYASEAPPDSINR